MAYMKKKYRDILEKVEKQTKLPKGWNSFVKRETQKDGIIIKSKGICICMNCQTKFNSDRKINDIEKCPNCKEKYIIRRSNCKHHFFEPRRLVFLDKIDELWVIRLFDVYSNYSNGILEHSKPIEYGRIVLHYDLNFINNRVSCFMYGTERVNPNEKIKSWRFYRNNAKLSSEGKLFYNNLEKIFKDTEYKYSQLWVLAKKQDSINIRNYIQNNLLTTEILIKMGLYNLALVPKEFNVKGSFEKRFGIDKSYYPFMKKHNINFEELKILRLYKKMNIAKLKYLTSFPEYKLEKIIKFITLDKFIDYSMSNKKFDMDLYLDYLSFLRELKIDLKNKKYLFPDNLKEAHDTYERQVEVKKNPITEKKINERYLEIAKNTFSDREFIIRPAKSIEELVDESQQQNNCVRTYADRYSKGECDIYLMRNKETPDKSLVTVAVRNNKVVQSRTKGNNETNKIQSTFLKKWETKILNAA